MLPLYYFCNKLRKMQFLKFKYFCFSLNSLKILQILLQNSTAGPGQDCSCCFPLHHPHQVCSSDHTGSSTVALLHHKEKDTQSQVLKRNGHFLALRKKGRRNGVWEGSRQHFWVWRDFLCHWCCSCSSPWCWDICGVFPILIKNKLSNKLPHLEKSQHAFTYNKWSAWARKWKLRSLRK